MNKYFSRVTSSARGEVFNPLTYPFFLTTLLFGTAFVSYSWFNGVTTTSLFVIMESLGAFVPFVWGVVALATIVMGITFLMFNIPPAGKVSGLIGFTVWLFAGLCWMFGGYWLIAMSIAAPNMYFWGWQYLSLRLFRAEDAEDKATMEAYDRGEYDDELNPKDAKIAREDNRGRDVQSEGSYDEPDTGQDPSRVVD